MAAGDFTASALQVGQIRLGEMFATPNIAQTELLKGSASTARALLAKNKSRTVPRLVGDKCVGVEAYFLRPHAESGIDFATPTTCTTPCGDESETVKGTYDTVVLAEAQGKVLDNRCDNLVNFGEELAIVQAHMMSQMRFEFNTVVAIPTLSAATQANLDTFMDATWDGTTNTPRITIPAADFSYERFPEFMAVAANNNFGDFFFVSGRLFYAKDWFAGINRNNEGFRDQAIAFGQQEMFFDLRDLDQTMTRKTVFAVDANSYAFWNTVRNTPTPQLQNTDTGRKWVWVQADPILTYMRDGRMVPVLYEFEMQETCVGRDEQKFQQNSYCLYGRLLGGLEFVPTGPNGEKGALQFSDQ
jgi:hypothetical protein